MNCKGIALITGLLILAAISLIAITAAGSMTLQRKQAANYRDKTMAMANAHVAESWAKAWLFSRSDIERQPSCIRDCVLPIGIHLPGELPESVENRALPWWIESAMHAGSNPASGEQPSDLEWSSFWVMEEIHYMDHEETDWKSSPVGVGYYRIYSFGAGRHPRSTVVTESIVARPWHSDLTPSAFPPSEPLTAFCRQFSADFSCGTVAWRQLK